jgi:hypothetical protein
LDYYQRYLLAKGQQNGEMIWLCAVVCRIELRKMGDPTEEAQNCQNLASLPMTAFDWEPRVGDEIGLLCEVQDGGIHSSRSVVHSFSD